MARDRRTRAVLLKEIARLKRATAYDEQVEEIAGLARTLKGADNAIERHRKRGAILEGKLKRKTRDSKQLADTVLADNKAFDEKNAEIARLKNDVAEAVRERDGLRELGRTRYDAIEAQRKKINEMFVDESHLKRNCENLRERLDEQTRRAEKAEHQLTGTLMSARATGEGLSGLPAEIPLPF